MAPQHSRVRWLRLWTDYTHGFDYGNQVERESQIRGA